MQVWRHYIAWTAAGPYIFSSDCPYVFRSIRVSFGLCNSLNILYDTHLVEINPLGLIYLRMQPMFNAAVVEWRKIDVDNATLGLIVIGSSNTA